MSNSEAVFWMKRVKGCTIVEKAILQTLCHDANGTRLPGELPKAFTAIGTITKMFDVDRRHIERAMDGLIEKGFISKEAQMYGRKFTSNNYFFHVDRYFPTDRAKSQKVGSKTGKVTMIDKREWNKGGQRILTHIVTCLRSTGAGYAHVDETLIDGLRVAGFDAERKIFWIVMPSREHETSFWKLFDRIETYLKKFVGSSPVLDKATGRPLPGKSKLPFEVQLIKLYKYDRS